MQNVILQMTVRVITVW